MSDTHVFIVTKVSPSEVERFIRTDYLMDRSQSCTYDHKLATQLADVENMGKLASFAPTWTFHSLEDPDKMLVILDRLGIDKSRVRILRRFTEEI